MISLIFPIAFSCAASLMFLRAILAADSAAALAGLGFRVRIQLALRLLAALAIGVGLPVRTVCLALAFLLFALARLSLRASRIFLGRLLAFLRREFSSLSEFESMSETASFRRERRLSRLPEFALLPELALEPLSPGFDSLPRAALVGRLLAIVERVAGGDSSDAAPSLVCPPLLVAPFSFFAAGIGDSAAPARWPFQRVRIVRRRARLASAPCPVSTSSDCASSVHCFCDFGKAPDASSHPGAA